MSMFLVLYLVRTFYLNVPNIHAQIAEKLEVSMQLVVAVCEGSSLFLEALLHNIKCCEVTEL